MSFFLGESPKIPVHILIDGYRSEVLRLDNGYEFSAIMWQSPAPDYFVVAEDLSFLFSVSPYVVQVAGTAVEAIPPSLFLSDAGE